MNNYELRIRNLVLFLIILGVILPSFSFGQVSPEIKLPSSLQELKIAGWRALKIFPEILNRIWQGFLGFLQKVWNFILNIWNAYVYPFFSNLWQKTLGKEIKERTPIIKEEFEKEKKEIKEEIKTKLPKVNKSLWERFKELIK